MTRKLYITETLPSLFLLIWEGLRYNAVMIIVLATLLQLQCGIQNSMAGSLSYGSVVFSTPDSSAPQFAYFEDLQDQFAAHPTCLVLQNKMQTQQPAKLFLSADGKRLLKAE